MTNKRGEFSPLTIQDNMKRKLSDLMVVLLSVGGALLFIASLFNLFFSPAWWGLFGFFVGASCFLLGWGELIK